MSLLNVNIKPRRLSLKEVKLSEQEQKVADPTPILTNRPPTAEEITYSKFLAISPAIDLLVNNLDLVSTVTGERIRKIDLSGVDIKPQDPPETATVEKVQKPKKSQQIGDIASRVIGKDKSLDKGELIARIIQETNVNRDRAEKGLNLMIETGVITQTNVGTYYLTGSTPF